LIMMFWWGRSPTIHLTYGKLMGLETIEANHLTSAELSIT
jgi:hypothetical protein